MGSGGGDKLMREGVVGEAGSFELVEVGWVGRY
jgi:hypothetical protein